MHQSKTRHPDPTGAANNCNARAHTRIFPKERFLPGVQVEEAGHQPKSQTMTRANVRFQSRSSPHLFSVPPAGSCPKADVEQVSKIVYENFPHARSVAHEMILLPKIITAPSASHPYKPTEAIPEARMSTGMIMVR
jgi:hypothetical protein